MSDKNLSLLRTISDIEVRAVARAFWRRIEPYKNAYGKDLPSPLPVEFEAGMATALSILENWKLSGRMSTDREELARKIEEKAFEIGDEDEELPI